MPFSLLPPETSVRVSSPGTDVAEEITFEIPMGQYILRFEYFTPSIDSPRVSITFAPCTGQARFQIVHGDADMDTPQPLILTAEPA